MARIAIEFSKTIRAQAEKFVSALERTGCPQLAPNAGGYSIEDVYTDEHKATGKCQMFFDDGIVAVAEPEPIAAVAVTVKGAQLFATDGPDLDPEPLLTLE